MVTINTECIYAASNPLRVFRHSGHTDKVLRILKHYTWEQPVSQSDSHHGNSCLFHKEWNWFPL